MGAINFLEFLALFGGLAAMTGYAPQVIHLVRVKDSVSMSLFAWYIWFVGTGLVLIYAISINNWVFITLDALDTILCLVIIILIYKYRKKKV